MVDWKEERHVFSALDWQFADGVILDHLRNADKRLAELTKDVLALAINYDLHVHKASGTPKTITHTLMPPAQNICMQHKYKAT